MILYLWSSIYIHNQLFSPLPSPPSLPALGLLLYQIERRIQITVIMRLCQVEHVHICYLIWASWQALWSKCTRQERNWASEWWCNPPQVMWVGRGKTRIQTQGRLAPKPELSILYYTASEVVDTILNAKVLVCWLSRKFLLPYSTASEQALTK